MQKHLQLAIVLLVMLPVSVLLVIDGTASVADAVPGIVAASGRGTADVSPRSRPGPCRAAHLRVRGGRESDGHFGFASATIQFTNTGADACRLRGIPSVIVRRHGSGAGLPLHYAVSHRSIVKSRTLAPGARWAIYASLVWSNWCGSAIHTLDVVVRLPGGGKIEGSFDGPPGYDVVPGCLDDTHASRLLLLSAYEKS